MVVGNRNDIKKKSGEKLIEYVPSLVGLSGEMSATLFGKKYFDEKFDLAHPKKFKDLDLNKLKLLFFFGYTTVTKITPIQGERVNINKIKLCTVSLKYLLCGYIINRIIYNQ